jgi:hypothetical protein
MAIVGGLVLAAVVVACGAGAKSQTTPASDVPPGASGGSVSSDPRARISELDAQIQAELERMAVPQPPTWASEDPMMKPQAMDNRDIPAIKAVCAAPPRPSAECGDICTLSDHICGNAEQICQLAAELAPDEWAAQKCDDGKRSCEAARKRCCECF